MKTFEKEILTFLKWNPESEEPVCVVASLEEVIQNPSGYKIETIGLHLLNIHRRERGLPQYRYNSITNTFDEVSP